MGLCVPAASRFAAAVLVPEATFFESGNPPVADVFAAGMGFGDRPSAREEVRRLLAGGCRRLVLDADALAVLALLASEGEYPCDGAPELVLTPHEGEAAKLLGWPCEKIASQRRAAVCEIASRYRATAVLKGPGTLVASADLSRIFENPAGNPEMALGGMGDLLSGVVAARWSALKTDAFLAASSAVWLHSAASDSLVAAGEDPSIANTAAAIGSLRLELETKYRRT